MKSRFIDIPISATFSDDYEELFIKINTWCGRSCNGYNVVFEDNEEMQSIDTSPIAEPP